MKKLLERLREVEAQQQPAAPTKTIGVTESGIKGGPGGRETYKRELQIRWEELLNRIRIHEMLKCLETEQRRLNVLRSNLNLDDLIAQQQQQQQGEVPTGGDEEGKGEESDVLPDITPSGHIRKSVAGTSLRSRGKKQIVEDVFRNKRVITDEEFEQILQLCDDKMEQQALREAFEEKKNRDKYLRNASEGRVMLYDFINSRFFVQMMLCVIIVSIVGIFLLTFEEIATKFSYPLIIMDSCIIGIFIVEAILKIIIYKLDYFLSFWNLLDTLIIIVFMLEVLVDLVTQTLALSTEIGTNIWFKFLKSLRALRLLRVIKFLPNLQVVLLTVFQSMLSIGSISVLMILFIFVFAVMGRGLFFESSPSHFGSIWLAFITLFQLLTLDDWFELLDPFKKDVESELQYWVMFFYLFSYIVIEFFVFLNLFVAVLVDNFQLTLADAEIRKKKEEMMLEDEGQPNFDRMTKEALEEELLQTTTDLNTENLELDIDDYYPIQRGSKEAKLYTEIFKDMASLDFEKNLWKRRISLANHTVDVALEMQLKALASIGKADEEDDKKKSESEEAEQ